MFVLRSSKTCKSKIVGTSCSVYAYSWKWGQDRRIQSRTGVFFLLLYFLCQIQFFFIMPSVVVTTMLVENHSYDPFRPKLMCVASVSVYFVCFLHCFVIAIHVYMTNYVFTCMHMQAHIREHMRRQRGVKKLARRKNIHTCRQRTVYFWCSLSGYLMGSLKIFFAFQTLNLCKCISC